MNAAVNRVLKWGVTYFPPNRHNFTQGLRPPEPVNVIVDATALIAGLNIVGEHNLSRWVEDGIVNLLVPLSTLKDLVERRKVSGPASEEAKMALDWVDQISTKTQDRLYGWVKLQGDRDSYATWEEVEYFQLPETLLSADNGQQSLDGLNEAIERNLSLGSGMRSLGASSVTTTAPQSPVDGTDIKTPSTTQSGSHETSPGMTELSPGNGKTALAAFKSRKNSRSIVTGQVKHNGHWVGGIPARLRPLLNFVVWRSNHADPKISGLSIYMLVTDDRTTELHAKRFGVRVKLLEKAIKIFANFARPFIPRSDLRSLEHEEPFGPDPEPVLGLERTASYNMQENDPNEVLFRRSPVALPPGVLPGLNLLDPDHFGRNPVATSAFAPAAVVAPPPLSIPAHQAAPTPTPASPQHSSRFSNPPGFDCDGSEFGRGGRGTRNTRATYGAGHGMANGGRGMETWRGRGMANGRGQAQVASPTAPVPRYQYPAVTDPNSYGTANGRGQPFIPLPMGPRNQYPTSIDPNSYNRSGPGQRRGRGGFHGRLWEPNT